MRRADDHAIQDQTDVLHAYHQPVAELDRGSHISSITRHGGMKVRFESKGIVVAQLV